MTATPELDKLSAYDFHLDEHLIARRPLTRRDRSRLLICHRESSRIETSRFDCFPEYLKGGDVLVVNTTRVRRSRLKGVLISSGRLVELLLIRRKADHRWQCLAKPGKKLRPHHFLHLEEDVSAKVLGRKGDLFEVELRKGGGHVLSPPEQDAFLQKHGRLPFPPYVIGDERYADRYQTVYAKKTGSAAAPTAGLHFTPELLESIKKKGIQIAKLNLEIGPGTFQPVRTEKLDDHRMHEEPYSIEVDACRTLNEAKRDNRRILAVGTTALRALEDNFLKFRSFSPGDYKTNLFIRPPYSVMSVDGLITNFHLPKSTLLMLVAAFAGYEAMQQAYREAIRHRYRFYSFGDAMLVI